MTPYMLIITLCTIAAFAVATRAAAKQPNLKVRTSEAIVATWNCQDKIPQQRSPAYSPWKHHSHAFRVWQLNLWTNRLNDCRAVLAERARQYNWAAWLPDKWRRIGQCETGLNWHHQNSSYEGAFGFAQQSWDNFKPAGYPDHASQATPWQQYQVALAIYNRYGYSGWGCRNA